MPSRFSPPGHLTDLTRDADLQAWSDTVSALVDVHVSPGGQLFNRVTSSRTGLTRRRIPWLAIPQTVADWRTVEATRARVDDPANRRSGGSGQNEYSEWFTTRGPAGEVLQVDLTTELPEYWRFLGQRLSDAELGNVYRQLWPSATDAELHSGGNYNPLNVWNTTRGAMHLIGVINTLSPDALGVMSAGIPWRFSTAGRVIDVQDCGMGVFHADTTLVANINRMAREGRAIASDDPVGVYIVDVDTSGWETPDGSDPRDLVTFSRGDPPMHARVMPPPGAPFRLADVRIAGEPIRFGSQIAERTVVGVTMAVGPPGEFTFTSGIVCGRGTFDFASDDMASFSAAPPESSHIVYERNIDG
ncbi:MAG TPA: hypothetical protein VGF28_16570 [Thermoanaerobaculia bacterium]|jgi:hypothetical protein